MRSMGFMVIALMILAGCAHLREGPTAPGIDVRAPEISGAFDGSPYQLWGEWTFYIPATHDRVDVVPRRQARLHLNALKFLEDYCEDCLQITKITNNGDGTIDLTVKIAHPFKGFPQYTAFDVRGIIMFNGTFEWSYYSSGYEMPLPNPCMISWREMGDPEVVNPDGYEYRWSPVYESGSDMPIYNYWPGKYSKGLPNAGLNAYLNFYSMPERHVFFTDSQVQRTYRIWLPPGEPVVAGYAVEACWEPPTVMPVKNPLTDFPLSANTSEPYFYDVVINNGEPILHGPNICCGLDEGAECDTLRIVDKEWDDDHNTHISWWDPEFSTDGGTIYIAGSPCGDEYPDSYWTSRQVSARPVGNHRAMVRYFRGTLQGGHFDQVFDFADYTVVPE